MKKIVSVLLLTSCLSLPCQADLYQSLRQVYETNPEILVQRQVVQSAGADVSLSKTGWQPSVGVSGGLAQTRTKLAGETYHETQKQIGVSASQNVFNGFATTADIKSAKALLRAEEANLYATEQDVFLEAIQAYINVLNAKEVLRLNKNNEKLLYEYYDLYVQKEKVGVLTKTDVAQAAARLEQAKYQVIDAQAQYDNAIETFKRIYGQTEQHYTDIHLKRLNGYFPKSIQMAETEALKKHPSILAMKARQTASEEKITVAKQTYRPSVDVKASATKYNDIPIVDEITDNRIGVYLTVPLYDRGVAFAATRKAKTNASAIREQGIHVQRLVLEKLRQAWNLYEAQKAAVQSAEIRIRASRLALDGVQDEQERGRRTVLDVLNAEQELLDAQVAFIQAKHRQISSYFAVLSGTGMLTAEHLGLK